MLQDVQNTYSNQQSVLPVSGTPVISTNVLDQYPGTIGFGSGGRQIFLFVQITQAYNTLTSLQLEWQQSADGTFSDGLTDMDNRTIALANLTLGAFYAVATPYSSVARYTRMKYSTTGSTPTTGAINAFLTDMIDGFNVVSLH